MRLGFISDLHIDVNPQATAEDYFDALVEIIKQMRLDMFFIGGDVANHYSLTLSFVENLQTQLHIPVYFIPGNHDYWQMEGIELTGNQIHTKFVQHPQSLLNKPLKLNLDVGLVGHVAWYNHAYHAPGFSEAELDAGKYRHGRWQDKAYIEWEQSDKELSSQFAKEIQADIEAVGSKQIILLTHMITYPGFVVPMPHKVFDFFNAFIATDDILPFYHHYPITHSIMGHVHFRAQRDYQQTKMIVNSLGYGRQWWTKSLREELKQSIYVINV
ncbi:metallophosphoesterase [Fundicoccus culcitae]|uniref:Metallophosphoesterase n=1 Tax=Fundicoccus culcitae TaxID=2969821 RepID=A0ABY5P7K7_9LACT|nr:metallophosphoesterase [Fundicoccus culcitae]UUX34393.1 metallophosphoesterase [Fundicoccus culcitae]